MLPTFENKRPSFISLNTLLKRVAKEEGPNEALSLKTGVIWLSCLPLVVEAGVEDEAVGDQDVDKVKMMRPVLSGSPLDNVESWRQQGHHLQVNKLGFHGL